MRYKIHHTPLAKADRSYRRTCSQAQETSRGPQHKFGPAKEAQGLILVGVDPTAKFSTRRAWEVAGKTSLPSSGSHHPGLIRTR